MTDVKTPATPLREAVNTIMHYQFTHSRDGMHALQVLIDEADDAADLIEQQAAEIERLRQPVQMVDEPVAWLVTVAKRPRFVRACWTSAPTQDQITAAEYDGDIITPLYTAAPAAPAYVPLSDEDLHAVYRKNYGLIDCRLVGKDLAFSRAIESLVVARMKGTP